MNLDASSERGAPDSRRRGTPLTNDPGPPSAPSASARSREGALGADPVSLARTLAEAVAGVSDLVEKYRLLAQLAAGTPGRTTARRDAMRVIADRFPGALREWDEAPRELLESRLAEAESLLADLIRAGAAALPRFVAPQHDWIRYSIAFHARLRAALIVKRFLAGRAPTEALAHDAAVALRAAGSDAAIDRARLEAIARPPAGRVSELIYGEVAAEAGLSVEALKAMLHPAATDGGDRAPCGTGGATPERGRT